MPGSDTGRVFISYRRQETAWPARQLYELLGERFGADQVFKDIDDIDPGDDFVDKITRAVSSCDVLLALIGDQWLTIEDDEGRRRLDDPADFVRLEIATALSRPDVRVIPILVDAARMPRAHELPSELEPLVRRQGVQLSAMSFDASRLMQAVSQTLADLRSESAASTAAGEDAEPLPPGQGGDDGTDTQDSGSRTPENDSRSPFQRHRTVLLSVVSIVGVLLAVGIIVRVGNQPDATAGGPRSSSSGSSSSSPGGTPANVDGPDVLAHRGGWEEYPLESLPALTSAARNGYAVETDVRWTSDNTPVIVHDEAARKGLDCTRPLRVSETTWSQLSKACRSTPGPKDNKRYPISTYTDAMEALAAIPGSWVYVEVKVDQTSRQQREFLAAIRGNGLSQRTVVTSFNPDYLRAIHAAAPDLRLMLFTGQRVPVAELKKEHLWAVAVKSAVASKKYVSDIQRAGLIVVDWPLNEAGAWATGKAVGADKVLTDYPNGYSEWLGQR